MASFPKVKIAITSVLLVIGVIFLSVGYSASSRAKAKELDAMLNDNGASIRESVLRSQQEGEAAAKQHELFDRLNSSIEKQAYQTRATIQYCTGWLMIAAAGIVLSLGRTGKIIPAAGL